MHAILQAPYGALRHRRASEYALSGGVGNRSLVPIPEVLSPPEERKAGGGDGRACGSFWGGFVLTEMYLA